MTAMVAGRQADDTQLLLNLWRRRADIAAELSLAVSALIYLRWADFQEAEREAVAEFEGRKYQPILPPALHWRAWHNLPPDELAHFFSDQLPSALSRLGNSREDPLATNLHRVVGGIEHLSGLQHPILAGLARWLARQPFETPQDRRQLLKLLDNVLNRSVDNRTSAHSTPRHIIDLMVALAAPRPGDRIYDPCFGSAGLLAAAFDQVRERLTRDRRAAPHVSISGVEINQVSYLIGLARLTLAGVEEPQLELGDSLEREGARGLGGQGFDLVLANPPWAARIDRERYRHRFPIPTSDVVGLFVQHALEQLRPHGRAVMVVPEGFLFQAGLQQELRRMLLEHHSVDAVVSLPPGSFLPYSGVKSSILLLRREGSTRQVRMVDASAHATGRQRVPELGAVGIARIVEAVRAPTSSADAWDVPIEVLADLEWDLTVRRADSSSLDRMIQALQQTVEVVPLERICRVIAGRGIPSRDLQDRPDEESFVPYVRIGDLRDGSASRATSWVSHAAAISLDAKQKLRLGDILLSKSGTIGKVGVVQNGAVGGVASQGLIVLRITDDRLDPHFLAAYLDGEACRSRLTSLAQGATIQHLRLGSIAKLLVPVPSLSVQRRVVEEHREHGVDAVAYLMELTGHGDRDPIAEWVAKTLRSTFQDGEIGSSLLDLAELDRLARDVRAVRNRSVHEVDEPSVLSGWLLALSEAIEPLQGIDRLPPGSTLYGALQEAFHRTGLTEAQLRGRTPEEAGARRLISALARQLGQWGDKLLNEVRLSVSAIPPELEAGTLGEVVLQVRNDGRLPIRDVQITTSPSWGSGGIALLTEGQIEKFALRGDVPKRPGPFAITCDWVARGIDGRPLDGSVDVPLQAMEAAEPSTPAAFDLGVSPYVCGPPVRPDRDDVFFGREQLIDDIRRHVIRSGNVILLEGNRRAGKSSILQHLEGLGPVPGWLGIYCSLQGAEGSDAGVGVPTVEVFRGIAGSIAAGIRVLGQDVPLPDGTVLPAGQGLGIAKACRVGIGEEAPFADCREYLEVALAHLEPHNCGLLLMLDEFDKLQEGIDNGITSPQVPENIRFLVQTYPRFSAVLTGSRRLKRLREEYWSALFGLGTRFSVTALSDDAARRLVEEPVKGLLTFSAAAVTRAIELVARQPFLLQCLCSRIFELAAHLKQSSISTDLVDRAAAILVLGNEHFSTLWKYAGSDRRRLILAICQREAGGPDPLRFGVLEERLTRAGVAVDERRLMDDLDFLRELEVLEKGDEASGGAYQLAIPLMGQWIDREQDFEIVVSSARAETEDEHA